MKDRFALVLARSTTEKRLIQLTKCTKTLSVFLILVQLEKVDGFLATQTHSTRVDRQEAINAIVSENWLLTLFQRLLIAPTTLGLVTAAALEPFTMGSFLMKKLAVSLASQKWWRVDGLQPCLQVICFAMKSHLVAILFTAKINSASVSETPNKNHYQTLLDAHLKAKSAPAWAWYTTVAKIMHLTENCLISLKWNKVPSHPGLLMVKFSAITRSSQI